MVQINRKERWPFLTDKPMWKSQTIIAALVSIATGVAVIFRQFGYDLSDADAAALVEMFGPPAVMIITGFMAWRGRMKANQTIR